MSKSSSPWLKYDNHFGVRANPRDLNLIHESDTSILRDLYFADTRLFPQVLVQWIREHHDLCEHYGLFPEYEPQVGFRERVSSHNSFINLIYDLCLAQNPTEVEYLEI